MTRSSRSTPPNPSAKAKWRRTPPLRAGEVLNPDNLRYLDSQGMPQEEGSGGFWASEVKAFLHAQTLKGLFYTEDWVFITTDSIALPISRCPLMVMQQSRADDGKNKRDALEDHPVSKLLAKPNPFQSEQELRYSLAVDTILGGNGFLYHCRPRNELYNMPFERVQYVFGKDGIPTAVDFFQHQQDDVMAAPVTGSRRILLDEVVHSRRPNPSSTVWGLSPFVPGRKSVLFNRYSQDYLLGFYLKGATPQFILEMDQAASQKALVRMMRAFEAAYTGRRNQRRTLVLPKGVKATQADTKIADQQLVELINGNRETVLNILRVPKHALGLQETGSLGSREHELALRWYWKQTILPTMELIEGALTRHFRRAKLISDTQVVAFDTSGVDYVQEDLLANAEISEKLASTWTLNERRERIFGLPKVPDGDKVVGVQTSNPFGALPPEAPAGAGEKKDGAEEEQPKETAAPEGTTAAPDASEVPEEQTLSVGEVQDPNGEWRARILKKYGEQIRAGEERISFQDTEQVPKMAARVLALLADQTERIIDVWEEANRAAPLGRVRAEDDEELKGLEERFRKAIDELEEGYLDDYTKTLMATVESGYEAQLSMIFDNKAKDALAAYQETDVKGQREILKARGLFQFQSARDTTTSAVTKEVEKGLQEGSTIAQVSDRILKFMKGAARWRADMIARTETLTAFSVGSMATLERAKEVIPGMKKMWITASDERVRETHKALMGKVVDGDAKFPNGLRYPRDPTPGLGHEKINCRCTALMLPPEDVADYVAEMKGMSKDPVEIVE